MSSNDTTLASFNFLVTDLGFECERQDADGFRHVVTFRRGIDTVQIGTNSDWRDPEYSVVTNGKKIFSLFNGWGKAGALDPAIKKLRKLFTDRVAKDVRVLSVSDFRKGDGDTLILVGEYEDIDVFPKDHVLIRIKDAIKGSGGIVSAKVSHGTQAIIVSGLTESQIAKDAIVSRLIDR